jgi:hypothetical protein
MGKSPVESDSESVRGLIRWRLVGMAQAHVVQIPGNHALLVCVWSVHLC